MTTEEKFNAAVNVIRSLPKNGSYQPSNDLMLRFYGYFKQATQGPCTGSRPPFWDVVGRAKYDAWKRLGDMPKKEAMAKYVDELHTIVETMSYSDKVATFLEAPTNELDSINMGDLELIAGDVLERVRSQPNSPLASREGSPCRFISSLASSRTSSPSLPESDNSDEDEEYIDTIENLEPRKIIPNGIPSGQPVQHVSRSRTRSGSASVDISSEISKAVQSLKSDIEKLSTKVSNLENSRVVAQKQNVFGRIPTKLMFLLIVWPFLASYIVNKVMLRRK